MKKFSILILSISLGCSVPKMQVREAQLNPSLSTKITVEGITHENRGDEYYNSTPAHEGSAALSAKGEFRIQETEDKLSLIPVDADGPVVVRANSKMLHESSVKKPVSKFFKSAYRSFQENTSALLILAFSGLMSIALLKIGERKSKQLTHWSKRNPVLSRGMIVGAQSVATLGGLALGHHLYNDGVMIPEYSRWLPIGLCTAAASFYPNQFISGNIPAFSYFRRKAHDIALFTSGTMLMAYAGNHYSIETNQYPTASTVISSPVPFSTVDRISLIKKDFNRYPDTPNPEKPITKGQAAGTMAAGIITFVLLTIIVAGLSCSLACSGNEAAAALVLVGGEGLLVWMLVSIIKKVKARLKASQTTAPLPS